MNYDNQSIIEINFPVISNLKDLKAYALKKLMSYPFKCWDQNLCKKNEKF